MKKPKTIKANPNSYEKRLAEFFIMIAGLWQFQLQFLKQVFTPPYEIEQIRKHMDELGIKTLPIVSVTGFIIGLVITMQMHPVMVRFGAEAFLPGSVGISIVRELAPVITALIFAGRVSSGIGAELGSMKVTEQIDAMEVSGANPYKHLVVTRILATTFTLPLLVLYADFIDLLPATLKSFVFGFFIGLVGCYKGFHAGRGTESVGKAANAAVVAGS